MTWMNNHTVTHATLLPSWQSPYSKYIILSTDGSTYPQLITVFSFHFPCCNAFKESKHNGNNELTLTSITPTRLHPHVLFLWGTSINNVIFQLYRALTMVHEEWGLRPSSSPEGGGTVGFRNVVLGKNQDMDKVQKNNNGLLNLWCSYTLFVCVCAFMYVCMCVYSLVTFNTCLGVFRWGKAAEEWGWTLSTIQCWG